MALYALILVLAVGASPAGAATTRCCGWFQQPGQMAISADGQHMYVSDYSSTLALRRDPDSGALTLIDAYDGGGSALELSPDGRHVYVVFDRVGPGVAQQIYVYKRDAGSGALSYVGRWIQSRYGTPRDIEFRDDRVAYLTDAGRDALTVLDRNPETGRLDMRRELRNGTDGVSGLAGPSGIAIAGDWLYTYERRGPHAVSAFHLAEGGDPTPVPDPGCDCLAYDDLEVTPDGRRLLAGPYGPYAFDRDPATGQLGDRPQQSAVSSGGDELADGTLALAPGGAVLYAIDWWSDRLNQYDHGPDGLTLRKSYYEGRDGQGINRPRAVLASPDGRHLYLAAGYVSNSANSPGGTISTFTRDPATGTLTFASIFAGPSFDGRPRDASGLPMVLKINGGDEYTNDPNVLLSLEGQYPAVAIEISNDGGFKNSERLTPDETKVYPWTLASSGPERLAKTVYVRLNGPAPYAGTPVTDEIILDERAPTILSARRAKKGLSLKVRDNLSGVSHVQATRNPRKPGRWRRFSKRLAAPAGRGRIHVRVRDRANNRSKWKAVGR